MGMQRQRQPTLVRQYLDLHPRSSTRWYERQEEGQSKPIRVPLSVENWREEQQEEGELGGYATGRLDRRRPDQEDGGGLG